ncbi:acyl-CoA thioesterase [Vibrio sp. S4M6]|uniref:acyl-CoA thioesterase n=1 Tax=Vibrio sinus TaxID=2946865 RepID=UPI00202A803A|nr:thioesterase family protein [Vibrio sinus]MCL9781974.1 acyl-CoA thioesterase [Vibrio sinus]
MFKTTIFPRFSDTDALGHINNTAFAIWFEEARLPIFKIFHPTLEVKSWPLIIARIEIDLLAQTYWGKDVEIRTYVEKVGNSSCHLRHEAWQEGNRVAKGLAILIHFDYKTNHSKPIDDGIRQVLLSHQKTSVAEV